MTKSVVYNLYWGVALVLLPIFVKAGFVKSSGRYAQDMALLPLAVGSISLFGFGKISRELKVLAFCFILLVFFNVYNYTSVPFMWQLIAISSCVLIALQAKSLDLKDSKILFNGIAISGIFQSLCAILNSFGYRFHSIIFSFIEKQSAIIKYSATGSTGTFGNQNVLGSFLAIILPVFFRKKWVWFLPLICYGIYLSKSTTPILVAIGCLTAFFIPKVHNYFKFAPFLGLLATFGIVYSEFFKNARVYFWKNTITTLGFEKNWLIGWGTAFVANNAAKFRTREIPDQLHNEYLELFVAYGLVGVTIFTWFFTRNYKHNNKIFVAMLAGSFVSSLTHFNMHIGTTALLFIFAAFYNDTKEMVQ